MLKKTIHAICPPQSISAKTFFQKLQKELRQQLEPTDFMNAPDKTDAWLMCLKQNGSRASFLTVFCLLAGLWCLHLHLLRIGDGGKDGGSWDLWPSLLPGRHLEQAGLLHRHGWVSNYVMMLVVPLVKLVCSSDICWWNQSVAEF